MTTLVAVRKGPTVALASDSQMSSGPVVISVKEQKILRIGGAYFGFTGSCASVHAIEHYAETLDRKVHLETRTQLFEFFRDVHKALKDSYFLATSDNNEIEGSGAAMLAITQQGIFSVERNRSVHEYHSFIAHGHGREYAFGAAHAAYESKLSASGVARRAIHAASTFDVYTGGEVQVKSIRLRKEKP